MNGLGEPVSLVSKEPASPRPPAVGKETRSFHDVYQILEQYQTYTRKMEVNKSSCHDAKPESPTVKNQSVTENTANAPDVSPNPSPPPPPPYRWAQSLQCLLEDQQGVNLFELFLTQEGHETRSLSLIFAIKGMKKTDPNDRERLLKLINILYDKKVKRVPTISSGVKDEIRRKLSSGVGVDKNIFDAAQEEVEAFMIRTTYPNFLNSDLYIQHLRGVHNEPVFERDCPVSPEAVDLLPTLHENSELNFSINKNQNLKETLWARRRMPPAKTKPEGQAGFSKSPYSTYSCYHTKYAPFLPASAQDSELQSLSSDAQTDDTMSQTDSSVTDFPMYKSKHKRQQKSRYPGIINKDKLCHSNFIPRTSLPLPPDAVKKPEEFHADLVKRLMKVYEERKKEEKIKEKLKSIEGHDFQKIDTFQSQKLPVKSLGTVMQTWHPPGEDNDEDILDQHMSWAFGDTGLTPAMSPVCASPPVSKPSLEVDSRIAACAQNSIMLDNLKQDLSYLGSSKIGQPSPFSVPYIGRIRRDLDTRSNDSGLTDWISEDNIPQCYRDADIDSTPYDYFQVKRTREKLKSMSKKLSSMTDSSSSCFDSGISVACESVQPSHSKVSHWLETKRCMPESEKDRQGKNSSTSPVLSRSSSSRKTVPINSSRSGVLDSGAPHWPLVPSQTLPQDPSMPPPDTMTNLIEARRRLEDESRVKTGKSKYVSTGRSSHDATRIKVSSRVCDTVEDGISHRKQSKKSFPAAVECGASSVMNNDMTIIGYSYGRGSVPYKSRLPGKNITLRQFKSLLSKRGNFRYFFKRISDDFGTGVVLDEVTDDQDILPLWEGKVFCVIESMDDGTVMNDD